MHTIHNKPSVENEMLEPSLTDSQKVNLNIITLNTAINDLQSDMKLLNQVVLIGNGELPLRETVRAHDAFIKDFKYWTRVTIGLLITQFVTFTTASIIAYLKFLPVLEKLAEP